MNFRNANELTIKTSTSTAGVSDFIKSELNTIPAGQALALVDLVTAVLENCPSVPNKHQAYTRINNVLSRNFGDDFVKLQGTDGYTYIARKEAPSEDAVTVSEDTENA
jgi:hypothetical protein